MHKLEILAKADRRAVVGATRHAALGKHRDPYTDELVYRISGDLYGCAGYPYNVDEVVNAWRAV